MLSLFQRSRNGQDRFAVGLHPDHVDVARVERTLSGRAVVRACDSYAKRGSDLDALLSLRRELKLNRFRCSTILNYGDYQMLQVEAPNVPAAELKSAVRWKLKDMLDYPVDAATVDVAQVPAHGQATARTRYVYAVSARNETVQRRMKLFRDAKLDLQVIDIPEMAQRNVAALFEEPGRGLALLAFGNAGGLLTFTAGGELYMARQLDVTSRQLVESDAQVRRQLLDRVVLEVQRSLDHFDRQFSQVPVAKLLLAPLPPALGIREFLADNLSAPVQALDLTQVMDFPGAPELREPERQGEHLLILGAALRADGAVV